jgi:RNA polymerase subunit RPABC4/transcription elongation factor Spt4
MVGWTFQDVRRRTHDWLVQILSLLLVMVFNLLGLFIYLILRPAETTAAVAARQLEEEALLQGLEEKLACPHCHKSVQADFVVCPYCGEELKQPCASCGRLLALNWTVCPYCATPVEKPVSTEETVDTAEPSPAAPVAAEG